MKNLTISQTTNIPTTFQHGVDQRIDELFDLLTSAVKNYHEFCTKYVALIDEGHFESVKIHLIKKGVTKDFLRRAEKVGRGIIVPEFLVDSSPVARRLMRCPISEQKKYYDGLVDVLTANNDVLKVNVSDLTREQMDQIFAHDHVRDIPAQKNYLLNQKKITTEEIKVKTWEKPYKVVRDGVVINGVKFSRGDVLDILKEMK